MPSPMGGQHPFFVAVAGHGHYALAPGRFLCRAHGRTAACHDEVGDVRRDNAAASGKQRQFEAGVTALAAGQALTNLLCVPSEPRVGNRIALLSLAQSLSRVKASALIREALAAAFTDC